MLALLLLVHHAAASDFPKDTNYVTRQVVSCPETGFFFRQEEAPNSIEPLCYLCFCQDEGSATCWIRENKRCNLKSYQIQKKDTRVRRSPLSLGELFVRDAAREFFNKQSPEQCKPYESSFSDGCPPVDWCIGCTVCDCDANGRWDCHILSFCPDKNGKKHMKKQKTPARNRIAKRRSKTKKSFPLQSTKNPPKNVTRKPIIKPMRRNQVMQSKNQLKQSIINKRKIMPVNGTKVKKFAAVKKTNPKLQARKSVPNNTKVTKNPLIIKKDISTNNPLNIQSSKLKINQNNTVEVAQKVVKQFMSTVQKMMKNFEKKANTTTRPANKVVKKRSMPKQSNKKNAKNLENKHMIRAKHISKSMKSGKQVSKKPSQKTTHKRQTRKNNTGRNKRQVAINESISDFNFTNYHQGNNRLDKINKTINFIDNSINTSFTTNSANEFFEVFAIPLNMDKEFLIMDNKTFNNNENIIMNSGSTSNVDINSTTPHYDDTDSVNATGMSVSWLLANFSTPFDKQNNSRNTEDVSNTTNDLTLSTKYMPYSIATSTTTTNRPEVTEYEHRNDSKYEIIISKNDKNFTNITEELRYRDNINHTCKFRTLLEKLIATDGNNVPQALNKPKRYTVMTKIKRLFKKIFYRNMKTNLYHDDLHYNFEPTLDHQKSGNLKMHSKEKYKLHQKIDLLRNESETILKTIRIIKGLLHVFEININKSAMVKYNNSYKDIGKLDAIMKNNFENEEIFARLSNDQRTQIKYIKENVHVFVKSMGNFATVLEDIIDIIKHHNQEHKVIDTKMIYNDNFKLTSEAENYKDTTKQKLEKLKKLLLNYNILQNTFVHQIYNMLNNIESNVTSKDNLKLKVHNNRYQEINKTNAIEANSANIIKNIRKLKVLAEKLNSPSRKKRETIGDDDAIEYLLLLMEYLLKKHPPNNPPLNDGIDLLIDAIKSAPDIEPIRKKVLNYVPDRTIVTRTTSPTDSARKGITYYKSKITPLKENSVTQTEAIWTKTTEVTNADEDDEVEEDDNEKNYQKFKSFKDSSSQQKDDMLEQTIDSTTINPYDKKVKSAHKSESSEVRDKGVNRDIDSTTFTSPSSATVLLETTTEYPTTVARKVKVNENIDDNFLVDTKANIDWIEANFKEIKQWKAVDLVSTTHKTVTRTRHKVKHTNNLSDVTKEIEDKKQVKPNVEVTTKKQNLLNVLDYAEKEMEDDVDSREDKFISDTY